MDGLIFYLLLLALAIGFGMGRLSRGRWYGKRSPVAHARYLEGLRQLIEEQHDAALDTLIGTLDVNETTIEMHFALGAFWRRKGEVDRAIRIHQNIIERSGLSILQLQQAQLELALDYTRSGLLDRAEALFQELANSPDPDTRRPALQELVYLYQEEREWEKAIRHAESLCQDAVSGELEFWRHLQAHYCCEQVESDLLEADGQFTDRRPSNNEQIAGRLAQARRFVPTHNRALLLQGRLELDEENLPAALETMGHLQIEEPYLMVILPQLIAVYKRADKLGELVVLIAEIYRKHRTASLIPFLGSLIHERDGNLAGFAFAERELCGREPAFLPDLLGMVDKDKVSFAQLQPILDTALPFLFHCEACGFEGKQFYWCCPTCKHWL